MQETRQAEGSPCESKYSTFTSLLQQTGAATDVDDLFNNNLQCTEFPNQLSNMQHENGSSPRLAGNSDQYGRTRMHRIDLAERSCTSFDSKATRWLPRPDAQGNMPLSHDIANYAKPMTIRNHGCRNDAGDLVQDEQQHPVDLHQRSVFFANSSVGPSHVLLQPSSRHSSAPPQVAWPNRYIQFQGLFSTSQQAKVHRHNKTRFERGPYHDPDADPTLPVIEASRQIHIERIYNAMIRGDAARDNAGSVAMRRWVLEPHYQSDLVEAYAHKVFDCLMEQVKEGFRGWHQNDYVADERKGEDEDRDLNCADRLDNIVLALEQEKTICEDVMSSASQIRMFVNAPKAYANRKRQNRVGNSKRPNSRHKSASDTNTRGARGRKNGGRRMRARSSTASNIPLPREIPTYSSSKLEQQPYFSTPISTSHALGSASGSYFAAPHPFLQSSSTPALHPSISFNHENINTMQSTAKPHQTIFDAPQEQYMPRMTPLSPAQQLFLMRSPATSLDRYSTSATPDVMPALHQDTLSDHWQHRNKFAVPMEQGLPKVDEADDSSLEPIMNWSYNTSEMPGLSPYKTQQRADFFNGHSELDVGLAEVEQMHSNQASLDDQSANAPDLRQPPKGIHSFLFSGQGTDYS